MPQHKINCPSCGQRLDVPEELAGEKTDCPTCQNVLTIPDFVHAFDEEDEIEAMPSHQSSTRMFGVIGVVIILLGAVGFFLISNEQISDSLSNCRGIRVHRVGALLFDTLAKLTFPLSLLNNP